MHENMSLSEVQLAMPHFCFIYIQKKPISWSFSKIGARQKAEHPYERKANDPSRPPLFSHHRQLVCISIPVSLLTQRKTFMQISAGTPVKQCIDILFPYPWRSPADTHTHTHTNLSYPKVQLCDCCLCVYRPCQPPALNVTLRRVCVCWKGVETDG